MVDNDVLIKLSRWRLATTFLSGIEAGTAVLGSAPFVCRSRVEHAVAIDGAAAGALEDLGAALSIVSTIEPTDAELRLASSIEDWALECGADIDAGESQLTAVAVMRAGNLVTGDKRAVAALARAEPDLPELSRLHFSVGCTEQVVLTLVASMGAQAVRNAVCSDLTRAMVAGFCRYRGPDPRSSGVRGGGVGH